MPTTNCLRLNQSPYSLRADIVTDARSTTLAVFKVIEAMPLMEETMSEMKSIILTMESTSQLSVVVSVPGVMQSLSLRQTVEPYSVEAKVVVHSNVRFRASTESHTSSASMSELVATYTTWLDISSTWRTPQSWPSRLAQ
jgi:hypothetical protein